MENLSWGLQTTVLGMGLVFALLAALWGLLVLVLRLDRPPAPAAQSQAPVEAASGPEATATAAQAIDADLLAAITVAALMHKAVRRREAAPVMRSYWPGSLLFASRWVAVGRSRQNRSWHRRGK